MPCDMVVTNVVEFLPTSTDTELLRQACESLGIVRYNFNQQTGELTLPAGRDVNEVKRAYSKATVEHAAKKNGWRVEWRRNAQGNEEAKILKRRY